ncbi:MAG: glycosyltransferase [Chitinophagaceae bacterium]|nr:glycosyltransferase [Chitinophagaceae bacterium]MBK7559322.1 glycosyltransferase [Chitinophagaceae bacterium]MBK9532101.1 glycosyltransferase [Chitinophagaceae bacterium]
MTMILSVIIVNYNVKHFLEQCLYSVQKACKGIDAEIIVADNNSTDGSRGFLEPAFPGVKFLWNTDNTGFAKANNQALEMATGDFILFLNPDTIIPEDCIEKCIQFFDLHKDAGAVGVRMIDGSGKFLKESKRAFPSPLTSLFKLSGLARIFPHSPTFARYHLGHLPEKENHVVDVLAGAFMMIPKTVLKLTGNFDDRFFMYGEDVDLSFRIQQADCMATGGKYKNYYFSETSIIHFKGESTKRGSLNYVRLFYKAMNLFVKKHYSGSKAGIFIFLIQTAIIIRAGFSAIGNLLKKIGLPILDAGLILSAFWITKILWSRFIRQEVNYSPNVLVIAFPAFTAIFLIAAYYSGLYDKGYKQSQLIRSTGIAALVLLSVYALLPESIRFSRGILIVGIFLAFILMNFMRLLFISRRYLETRDEQEERQQTVVVAGEKDFTIIAGIMNKAGMPERVLGRVAISQTTSASDLGTIVQLPNLVKRYPVKEIIFCENGLSFKEIISTIEGLPAAVRNKFHATGSVSIVGSDSKNVSGDFVAATGNYTIGDPINRRNKRLLDIMTSVLFIIGFPFLLFIKKGLPGFYKNVFWVLTGKKTWIGYAAPTDKLPALKKGIISSTSLPAYMNELPVDSLSKNDEWYASNYSAMLDLKKITRGFKYLHH